MSSSPGRYVPLVPSNDVPLVKVWLIGVLGSLVKSSALLVDSPDTVGELVVIKELAADARLVAGWIVLRRDRCNGSYNKSGHWGE